MFTLNFSGGGWLEAGGNFLQPGEVHTWSFPCEANQAASITAFPFDTGSQLSVEVLIEGNNDQSPPWTLSFNITNTGTIPIGGYNWAWLLANNQGSNTVIPVG